MQNNPNVASLNQKLSFVATLLDKMVLELNLKTFNVSMYGNHNKTHKTYDDSQDSLVAIKRSSNTMQTKRHH